MMFALYCTACEIEKAETLGVRRFFKLSFLLVPPASCRSKIDILNTNIERFASDDFAKWVIFSFKIGIFRGVTLYDFVWEGAEPT